MAYWRRGGRAVDVDRVFLGDMTVTKATSVTLTRAHRDAIFEEIEFAFESACDLAFMLEHAPGNTVDSDDARELIMRLRVAVALLDQIGWERSGDRDDYTVEVDEAVDWFAARIESFALAGLEYNREGLVAGEHSLGATARRLIDADLDKLKAARLVRTAYDDCRDLTGLRESLQFCANDVTKE
jgi:hypothetical protein